MNESMKLLLVNIVFLNTYDHSGHHKPQKFHSISRRLLLGCCCEDDVSMLVDDTWYQKRKSHTI